MNVQARLAEARAAGAKLFRAPGRVNIIGEHTDYNEGLVLPTNTALYTWLSVKERSDRRIRISTKSLDASAVFHLDELARGDDPTWIDYVKGVAWFLESEGVTLRGADISIDGEIPIGGGLSSSASLELAVAVALLDVAGTSLPPRTIAELCQAAEREFAGVNCGIMDQYSIACGQYSKAMLLDCRTFATEYAPIPTEMALVVTDSGVKHKLPDSGYNDRANECSQAVRLLKEFDTTVTSLRDASTDLLESRQQELGDTLYRRSHHVVTEIQRVRDAFEALRAGDARRLGTLVKESHASLRDDFEVSCDEVESLVEIADRCDGVLGSRIVGAGFGGCVLSVVDAKNAGAVMDDIGRNYATVSGRRPWIHCVTATDPAVEVSDV